MSEFTGEFTIPPTGDKAHCLMPEVEKAELKQRLADPATQEDLAVYTALFYRDSWICEPEPPEDTLPGRFFSAYSVALQTTSALRAIKAFVDGSEHQEYYAPPEQLSFLLELKERVPILNPCPSSETDAELAQINQFRELRRVTFETIVDESLQRWGVNG